MKTNMLLGLILFWCQILTAQSPVASWQKTGVVQEVNRSSAKRSLPVAWQKTLKSRSHNCLLIMPGLRKDQQRQVMQQLIHTQRKSVYRVSAGFWKHSYIGETEKNLSSLLTHAEKKGWILFFDEADAIFGKRTEVSQKALKQLANFKGTALLSVSKAVETSLFSQTACKHILSPDSK